MITIRRQELYRYLGYRGGAQPDAEVLARIAECEPRLMEAAAPKFLIRQVPVESDPGRCSSAGEQSTPHLLIAGMEIASADLRKNLEDCDEVYLFAATLGPGPDLLIRRASAQRMTDAVIYQAMSAEMIESYCDEICAQLRREAAEKGLYLNPRLSPGYGDLPLELQQDLLRILDAPKKIGLTLTDSLLMMPSKSVTALIGLTKQPQPDHEKDCAVCPKTDCTFRRE